MQKDPEPSRDLKQTERSKRALDRNTNQLQMDKMSINGHKTTKVKDRTTLKTPVETQNYQMGEANQL